MVSDFVGLEKGLDYMYICIYDNGTVYECSVSRGQKRATGPIELEEVVPPDSSAGYQT